MRVEIPENTPTVKNIKSDSALKKLISVVSEKTGKPVKYSVKISRKKVKKADGVKIYKVTYKISYSSSAGNKNVVKTLKVNTPD